MVNKSFHDFTLLVVTGAGKDTVNGVVLDKFKIGKELLI